MKKRNSSLELLRILCMIAIIFHHYSFHGGYDNFSADTFSLGVLYIQEISMFGKIACSIFALITGYFFISKEMKISESIKKIAHMFTVMLFYGALIAIVLEVTGVQDISIKKFIKSIISINEGNWYFLTYFLILLIAPFINKVILRSNQKEIKRFLIVAYVIWSIIPTFLHDEWQFSTIDFFVIMYITGAYIKLYAHEKLNFKKSLWITIISLALLLLSVVVFDFIGVKFNKNIFVTNATYFRKTNSILSVIAAISIFNVFSLSDFNNRIINVISSTTMGVYLIHDNLFMRDFIWKKVYPNVDFINNPYIHSFIKVICIYLLCMMIEFLRKNTIDKIYYKVEKYFENILRNVKFKRLKILWEED